MKTPATDVLLRESRPAAAVAGRWRGRLRARPPGRESPSAGRRAGGRSRVELQTRLPAKPTGRRSATQKEVQQGALALLRHAAAPGAWRQAGRSPRSLARTARMRA